jgi:serine/threonine protein kinase
MSSVYLAIDPLLNREVALKVIHPHLTHQPGLIKRFEREAIALARLEHPNIVKIFDIGEESDRFFIVIQLLNGGTLKDRLLSYTRDAHGMPLDRVSEIMGPVCQAVDYFHQSGMIHRDLKPSNIMFDEKGIPFIADFGIVKIAGWEGQTLAGSILGTPFYMSPEQFEGKIDHRTDIYSLGLILYEMSTGVLPHKGVSISDLIRIRFTQEPPPPETFYPDLPQPVSGVILKALARLPDDRYQSAGDLFTSFAQAIPAPKPSPVRDTVRFRDVFKDKSPERPKAFLRSMASGVRYPIDPEIENRIGRSRPQNFIEVDLQYEKGSEFVHTVHAILRHSADGWELETSTGMRNPVLVNDLNLAPGEKTHIAPGDSITFSRIRMIFEI